MRSRTSVRKVRIPKLCRHPNGQGFIYISREPFYLGQWDDPETMRKYHQACAELLATGVLAIPTSPSEILIKEIIARFVCHAESYYCDEQGQPTPEQVNFKPALAILTELYGETPAIKFGPRCLQAVRQKMVERGWCRSHVNRQIARLKFVFRWAVENELIPVSIHQTLATVRGLRKGHCTVRESKPVRPAAIDLVTPLEPHLSKQVWAIVQLQLLSAARCGELLKLRKGDIDRSVDPWEFRNEQDFQQACERLGIQKVQITYPGGRTKVGLGRVVDGAKAMRTLTGGAA